MLQIKARGRENGILKIVRVCMLFGLFPIFSHFYCCCRCRFTDAFGICFLNHNLTLYMYVCVCVFMLYRFDFIDIIALASYLNNVYISNFVFLLVEEIRYSMCFKAFILFYFYVIRINFKFYFFYDFLW